MNFGPVSSGMSSGGRRRRFPGRELRHETGLENIPDHNVNIAGVACHPSSVNGCNLVSALAGGVSISVGGDSVTDKSDNHEVGDLVRTIEELVDDKQRMSEQIDILKAELISTKEFYAREIDAQRIKHESQFAEVRRVGDTYYNMYREQLDRNVELSAELDVLMEDVRRVCSPSIDNDTNTDANDVDVSYNESGVIVDVTTDGGSDVVSDDLHPQTIPVDIGIPTPVYDVKYTSKFVVHGNAHVDDAMNCEISEENFVALKDVIKVLSWYNGRLSEKTVSHDSGVESVGLIQDADIKFPKIVKNISHLTRVVGYIGALKSCGGGDDYLAVSNSFMYYLAEFKLCGKKTVRDRVTSLMNHGIFNLMKDYICSRGMSIDTLTGALSLACDSTHLTYLMANPIDYQVCGVHNISLPDVELRVKVHKANQITCELDGYYKKHRIGKMIGTLHHLSHIGLTNKDLAWYHMGKSNVISEASNLIFTDDNNAMAIVRPIRRCIIDPSYVLMRRMSYVRDKVTCVEVSGGRLPIEAALVKSDLKPDSTYLVNLQVAKVMSMYSVCDLSVLSCSDGSVKLEFAGLQDARIANDTFNCCDVMTKHRHDIAYDDNKLCPYKLTA
jgi:hypothetical protein